MAGLQFWENTCFQDTFKWVQRELLSERKGTVIPCRWTENRKGAPTEFVFHAFSIFLVVVEAATGHGTQERFEHRGGAGLWWWFELSFAAGSNSCLSGLGLCDFAPHRCWKSKAAKYISCIPLEKSNPCWNGGRIFFSRVDFLCWLLFRYPFHPRVTTVARKKSRSFCQKVQVAGYS